MATRTVTLTDEQAEVLLDVARNGCADGDFFGANEVEPYQWFRGEGLKAAHLYNRAIDAICDAFNFDADTQESTKCPVD